MKCLEKELRQLKTKPKFDIDKHKDSDDDVAFFTGFPSYDVMLFCFNLTKQQLCQDQTLIQISVSQGQRRRLHCGKSLH